MSFVRIIYFYILSVSLVLKEQNKCHKNIFVFMSCYRDVTANKQTNKQSLTQKVLKYKVTGAYMYKK